MSSFVDAPDRAAKWLPCVPQAVKVQTRHPEIGDGFDLFTLRRTDNDQYSIPGGAQDIGETVAQAAIRETAEETGIDIEITGLIGVYSRPWPRHRVRRRRSASGVLPLLPRPSHRRHTPHQQRKQRDPLGSAHRHLLAQRRPRQPPPHRTRLAATRQALRRLISRDQARSNKPSSRPLHRGLQLVIASARNHRVTDPGS